MLTRRHPDKLCTHPGLGGPVALQRPFVEAAAVKAQARTGLQALAGGGGDVLADGAVVGGEPRLGEGARPALERIAQRAAQRSLEQRLQSPAGWQARRRRGGCRRIGQEVPEPAVGRAQLRRVADERAGLRDLVGDGPVARGPWSARRPRRSSSGRTSGAGSAVPRCRGWRTRFRRAPERPRRAGRRPRRGARRRRPRSP